MSCGTGGCIDDRIGSFYSELSHQTKQSQINLNMFPGLNMSILFMKPLFFSLFFLLILLLLLHLTVSTDDNFFSFNGFSSANLTLDSFASITSNGLLDLTNATSHTQGHAFYPLPLQFISNSTGKTLSFSTTFVFAILSEISYLSGHGFAFVISPSPNLSTAQESRYLGLFNLQNDGNSTNHIFAVEFDTIQNIEFGDIDNNHVGIDINSLESYNSHTAGYYRESSTGSFTNLSLISGQPMQVWVDFDGEGMQLNVTLSPMGMVKPNRPLLSSTVNLTSLMMYDTMYAGFSSSTGSFHTSHCILGWSFNMNGLAEPLDYANLPSLPRSKTKGNSIALAIWLLVPIWSFLMFTIFGTVFIVRRRKKYAELLEDWELPYGPHRFSYKDLFESTKGFRDEELLGAGGFGSVYRGVLPTSNVEVAIKKVSHESRQGMKEFVAEIVSIGQLRHRNLVQLLGYCRRKGELLLVYEFMPNGSLDRFIFDKTKPTLNWAQRFRVIKGVASGLLYLHEDWEQVVIHRDIKASNVLIDSEFNGRLGDFGLARLYDHGTDAQTTHVIGTLGYLAPELNRTGKSTTATDVYSFGAFLLEVACGKRPLEAHGLEEEILLKDWVLISWQQGLLLETMDTRLREDYYCVYEVELILKLGLLCLNPIPASRPTMRQILHYLEGDMILPELPQAYMSFRSLALFQNEGFDYYTKSKSFASSVASISGISGGH